MSQGKRPTDRIFICRNCGIRGYLQVDSTFSESDPEPRYEHWVSHIWEICQCTNCQQVHLVHAITSDGEEYLREPEIVIPDPGPSQNLKALFGQPSQDEQFDCDVFMMMPFRKPFFSIYNNHIVPTIKGKKLSIKYGEDFFANQTVMKNLWSAIFASKLVIADCTGKNVNVFYELGIAHTIGKPAILITQHIDDIPFDINQLRAIPYEYDPINPNMGDFENKLDDAVTKLLGNS